MTTPSEAHPTPWTARESQWWDGAWIEHADADHNANDMEQMDVLRVAYCNMAPRAVGDIDDIRRIVACVNACAGIPTRELEGWRFVSCSTPAVSRPCLYELQEEPDDDA